MPTRKDGAFSALAEQFGESTVIRLILGEGEEKA
jgi:hypothetical protein